MKVLQTAGQIGVHQVAAKRFNTVRKRGESGESKPKTKQGRTGKKGDAGEKAPAERRGGEKDSAARSGHQEGDAVSNEGVKGGVGRGNIIQQTFKNLGSLKGVGTLETNEILKSNGLIFKGRTPGGYYKYYHPNGAKIQIRPDGQVYRYGGGRGLKYNSDGSLSKVHGQESILK